MKRKISINSIFWTCYGISVILRIMTPLLEKHLAFINNSIIYITTIILDIYIIFSCAIFLIWYFKKLIAIKRWWKGENDYWL